MNWTHIRDGSSDTDRVPELLERAERQGDAEAWKKLGWPLVLEHALLSAAGFAALPRLVRLAPHSPQARGLAGKLLERAAGRHGSDDLPADCASPSSPGIAHARIEWGAWAHHELPVRGLETHEEPYIGAERLNGAPRELVLLG
ncbi:hypothetical protein [Streptomyces aureus]|uniref:hypothetical protein n=1 Tax=Streptomyces aureus TaxID=193461 RepID=UPI0006E461F8|nr:hypothetical protein [Streptomyces aureus]